MTRMNNTLINVISGVLTAVLGGGVVKAVLDYLRDRRRDRAEGQVSSFQLLEQWNVTLQKRVTELETALDTERQRRRIREDELLAELATERQLRRDLEGRIARLEKEISHDNDRK